MKKLLVAGFVLMFAASVVLAQTTNKPVSTAAKTTTATSKAAKTETGVNKNADIRTLLTLTQSGELASSMMQEMLNTYQRNLPQVPEEFWLKFAKKIKTDELVEMLVPIYDRHLTHSEVVSLIKFFGSPVGKKLVSVQPEIMKESMQVGQQWGEKIGNEVTAELQKKGYR